MLKKSQKVPHLANSSYTHRPWYLPSAHLETIIPSMFYQVKGVNYTRERLELDDGDFLDLDWCRAGYRRLMILSHGLEGNAYRPYIMRPAKYFHAKGWDILAWNCRGCSGEINRLAQSYHHGDIADITTVIEYALKHEYEEIVLVGFSMGGNMQLKYLGTHGTHVDRRITAAVGFSVPCHLEDSAREIEKKSNRIYLKRFLGKLQAKLEMKAEKYPELKFNWEQIHSFQDFNRAYTLPVYGFASEEAFYQQARTDHLLENIAVPTLMVNAWNDPMLGGQNFPIKEVKNAPLVTLETPKVGGHVGFSKSGSDFSWMELRTNSFLEELAAPKA